MWLLETAAAQGQGHCCLQRAGQAQAAWIDLWTAALLVLPQWWHRQLLRWWLGQLRWWHRQRWLGQLLRWLAATAAGASALVAPRGCDCDCAAPIPQATAGHAAQEEQK